MSENSKALKVVIECANPDEGSRKCLNGAVMEAREGIGERTIGECS